MSTWGVSLSLAKFRHASEGSEMSFEQTQVMVRRWQDEQAEWYDCPVCGLATDKKTARITPAQCEAYRRGKRQSVSEDEYVTLLDACLACKHYPDTAKAKGSRKKRSGHQGHYDRVMANLLNWLTVSQTASRLHRSSDTVYGLIDRGELEFQRVSMGFGKSPKFYVSERSVDKWLAKREQERLLNATV